MIRKYKNILNVCKKKADDLEKRAGDGAIKEEDDENSQEEYSAFAYNGVEEEKESAYLGDVKKIVYPRGWEM